MSTIKILCFAILGMIAGNAECALPPAGPVAGTNVLDFDTIVNIGDNIPAMFQPKIYEPAGYNAAGPNNLRYVYFSVFNPGEVEDGNFRHAVVRHPVQTDHNIFFPTDGSQPTTPEAVEYSCANIDNRPDSPITEWYMKVFGVIPINQVAINAAIAANILPPPPVFVHAGWRDGHLHIAQYPQRVISFDANCSGHPHNNCSVVDYGNTHAVNDPNIPGAQISRRALFEREFRKIASSSVGRVLLYRILIEVRRHRIGSNAGCTEDDRYFTDTTISRRAVDRCRNVRIMYMPTFGFDDTDKAIFFYENPNNIGGTTPLIFSVIGKTEDNYTHIVQSPTTLDVVLFHEMSHWFHHLRHPKRYYDEINGDNRKKFENCLSVNLYYWDDIDVSNMPQNYANIWYAGNLGGNLDFEEMRNMLGMPHDHQSILKGDDLCENLYRMNQGLPLRFGYSGVMFYEDKKVTDRVIDACITNNLVYVTAKNNVVNFQYNEGVNGAGASKIHH